MGRPNHSPARPGRSERVTVSSGGGGGGATWTVVKAANADRTLAGQGSVTWSDESGDELRSTVDTTETQIFNSHANHGGELVFDTGFLVSDMPKVAFRFNINTTPATAGADVYFNFGIATAASVGGYDPSTDKSVWHMTLAGPVNEPGTTVQVDMEHNNNNPGTGTNKVNAQAVGMEAEILEGTMSGASRLVHSSGASIAREQTSTNITGLTSTDKVLIIVSSGHRALGSTPEAFGGKLQFLATKPG